MAVETLRPTSTPANGTSSLTGAATRHEALADDDDASYVDLTGQRSSPQMSLGFTMPSLPGDPLITGANLRVRARGGSSTPKTAELGVALTAGGEEAKASIVVGPSTIDTTAVGAYGDGSPLQLLLWGGADRHVRLYEVLLDLVYIAKPVVTVSDPSGTLNDENRPTVEWSVDFDEDADAAQRRYSVRVFTDAVYGRGDRGQRSPGDVVRDPRGAAERHL
jgi:hypothetical protein